MRCRLLSLLSLLSLLALLPPLAASALMPPHVTATEPANGGQLEPHGRIVIHGFSLNYSQPDTDLKLVDTTTKKPVGFAHTLTCKSVGKCGAGSPPGACQSRCTLTVTPQRLSIGQSLELRFLGAHLTLQVAHKAAAVPRKAP